MENNLKVHILLSTYNGSKFIIDQLDSLLRQTHENWILIIRDDGSIDETEQLINHYQQLDDRIFLEKDCYGNLRSCQSFGKLMESVRFTANYVMFCDQDDIWEPNKIEKSLAAIKSLEVQYGSNVNLMVYGTYKMIDDENMPLSLDVPDYSSEPNLKLLLSQNYVYGCTVMINKHLLRNSLPIPLTAENHDYWITLTAILNEARFLYIDEPLILYRQHKHNVSGSYVDAFLSNRIKRLFSQTEINSIKNRLRMFTSLYERFKLEMSYENQNLLKGYIDNVNKGGLKSLIFCAKNRISRRGRIQTILFYFYLLRFTRS
ncbi:glycosyltransferase [Pedobacter gandavensis]|uniref:glycosyltransferase n=1 Tax=Pedobacter gandavensis TaxID=2679963 RepID=UPI00292CBD2D|nr:glycosyltransferase [Pedobacter gandavensis]